MALNAAYAPSGNFDLSNWKITLPVDSSGGITGTAVEVQNLTDYTRANMFWTGSDGAMVFRAAVDGATTSGSNYARSELREMNGTARAAWSLTTGGIMTATLEVDAAPTYFNGTLGRVVVGQIHGANDELVRLYWENNKLYFVNDQSGANNTENKFYFVNASGLQPNVSLDERFSYVIDAKGNSLEVTIYADGEVYKSVTTINSVWQTDTFYFKAGVYLGVNETQGTGFGQASFYDLRFNHTDTALSPLIAPVVTDPVAPPPVIVAGMTIYGTDDGNVITGGEGNDFIYAKRGNDTVNALGGDDTVRGGTGSDVLNGGTGNDSLFGEDGWDTLVGGQGADRLSGGYGGDTFKFNSLSDSIASSYDTITDFSSSQGDRISLSNIDANSRTDGNQSFKFIGTSGFTNSAGQLRYYKNDGNTFVEGDVNGDGIGDFLIMVASSVSFTSADFML